MNVVTIVGGELYRRMAEVTVPLMRECLNADVRVIEANKDPFLQKLTLLSDDIYAFVDVDVVFRSRYDLTPAFIDAERGWYTAPIPEYAERLGLPPTFVTSGMFVLNPDTHGNMLAAARHLYEPGPTESLKDEYALNTAIQQLETPVRRLPSKIHRVMYNRQPPQPDDVSRHYCGGAVGPVVRLAHIRHACELAWDNLKKGK